MPRGWTTMVWTIFFAPFFSTLHSDDLFIFSYFSLYFSYRSDLIITKRLQEGGRIVTGGVIMCCPPPSPLNLFAASTLLEIPQDSRGGGRWLRYEMLPLMSIIGFCFETQRKRLDKTTNRVEVFGCLMGLSSVCVQILWPSKCPPRGKGNY